MRIKPLFDRVVIKEEKEDVTQSGIFMGNTNSDNVKIGTVLSVGTGNDIENDKKSKMYVNVGDKVIYSKFSGIEANIDNQTLFVIRQTDILAVIE